MRYLLTFNALATPPLRLEGVGGVDATKAKLLVMYHAKRTSLLVAKRELILNDASDLTCGNSAAILADSET